MRTNFLKLAASALILLSGFAAGAQAIRGYTGTQVFQNCGNPNSTEPYCGVIASAELWITFLPEETGVLYMNTDGSTFNTVMAAFIRSSNNPALLQYVGCDNNSGLDGQDSALAWPVRGGETNYVVFGGVNGACGTVQINYNLVAPSRLAPLTPTGSGQFRGRITGRAGMKFVIDRASSLMSSNLTSWTPLLTNTSAGATFDFTDTTMPVPARRFYRARMLP